MHIILTVIISLAMLAVVLPVVLRSNQTSNRSARKFGPPYEAEVNTEEFKEMVMDASRDVPVLVDFYAPWCEPCNQLAPVLSKLSKSYRGNFLLAKVNVDNNGKISVAHGIRAMPTVMLFHKGRSVGSFRGVQTENWIRQFLQSYSINEPPVHLKSVK